LTNLILLCGRHHRLVHEGGYRVESPSDNVFAFVNPAGRVVPEAPPTSPVTGPGLAQRNESAGVPVTPDTCRSLGEGGPYDLSLAVEALLTAAVPAQGREDWNSIG
jgi:hypothetical protein